MNTTTLVAELKEADEDFEFYPTTKAMVQVVYTEIMKKQSACSLLDIGAGNGTFFTQIGQCDSEHKLSIQKYAIEKSLVLIQKMDTDIFVIGTDFHQQTLLDKKIDVIFCNPPYSEYSIWAERIIREAACEEIYLVIPERWKQEQGILDAIEKREWKYEILTSSDFLASEFRKSRAKIDIIKLWAKDTRYDRNHTTDPFSVWFDSFFSIAADKDSGYNTESTREKEQKERIRSAIVKGQNLIERLEELYQQDLEKLFRNYRTLETLDADIFKELKIDIKSLKEGLRLKIEGLKNLYWRELFDNFHTLTSRLTSKSRNSLYNKLTTHTSIDFTAANAYAVVIWAIKNTNQYINAQLLEVYDTITYKENVRNYKSNTHMWEDTWRYGRDQKHTHYTLDYRIVVSGYNNFNPESYGDYDYPHGLYRETHHKINDIITVATNLGFQIVENTNFFEWKPGKQETFNFVKDDTVFAEIRAFKNGNIHCKFDQKFMQKFNVEAGRLHGWIKSPQEAADEMNIPLTEVRKYYNSNQQLTMRNVPLLPEGTYDSETIETEIKDTLF